MIKIYNFNFLTFFYFSRQLGHKGNAKLVSLVQGLSHQVHLFLVEYNKVNHLQLNLPGFKPRNANSNINNANNNNNNKNSSNSSGESNVPEEILHQQRLLLQSCDRYVIFFLIFHPFSKSLLLFFSFFIFSDFLQAMSLLNELSNLKIFFLKLRSLFANAFDPYFT